MRKFGEDLAPISERVLELGGIVINVIFAKEGIKALPEVKTRIGALWSSLPDEHPRSARMSLDVDGFNDYPGSEHEDILAMFDRAVASAVACPLTDQVELTRP